MAESLSTQLRNYYNIGVKTSKGQKEVIPMHKNTKTDKVIPVKFPSSLEQFWQWWVSQTHDSNETLRNRFDRYDDIDYMIKNDGIMGMVSELYADEATQADAQDKIISADSKDKKVIKAIEELLVTWDFAQTNVRNHCYNIANYGDSFTINSLNTKDKLGIYGVEHIDIRDVMDRIEFRLSDVKKNMYKKRKMYSFVDREPRLFKLAQMMEQSEDISQYFKSYLFGYQIDRDVYLPPWNVSHFRMNANTSEFRPWGRSLLINCIALFRQLKASKNLMAMARAAKFPKEVFKVAVDENMTEADMWEKINEAREEWHNVGISSKQKDQFAIGGEIWTADGLLSYDLVENRMNLDDIADIELLRDDMIIASRIPKGYLIVDRGAFGVSGQSLLQQSKPFGRAVYSVQSAFLHELIQMIRIHFMSTGQFDGENTEFTLAMNFPITEEAQDRIRAKSDTLRLANDIISNIQSALGTRDGLPPEVIKSVFSTISFMDPEDTEKWIDQSYEALHEGKRIARRRKDFKEDEFIKIKSRLNEDVIRYAYFSALKKQNFKEGILNKKHIVNSVTNISPQNKIMFDCLKYRGEPKSAKLIESK